MKNKKNYYYHLYLPPHSTAEKIIWTIRNKGWKMDMQTTIESITELLIGKKKAAPIKKSTKAKPKRKAAKK